MSNPSKQKGTGGETELKAELEESIPGLVRTPPTMNVDLWRIGDEGAVVHELLATRPDRGQWLITMDLDTFRELIADCEECQFEIEVKRYARFSLHAIWDKKFGRKKL